MAIKAIALDIDGTLTNDDKVITPRTREALLAAQRDGIRVILASGRPTQGIKALARELELPDHGGLIVSYNGAHVTDAATDEVLFDQPMSPGLARAVVDHMRSFDVITWITEGTSLYMEHPERCMIEYRGKPFNIVEYERVHCDLTLVPVDNLCDVCDRPQDKILVAATGTYLDAHWEELAAPFKDRLSCMFTAEFYFEFMAPGIDKANALAGALPKLGIDASEVVAFGDGQNDARMLAWAGCGVAMANAIDETKAAADMVTASNNEDGVASALGKILG